MEKNKKTFGTYHLGKMKPIKDKKTKPEEK
jgi:hypothetical protein